eukprot:CFRG8061T1
MTLLHIGDLSEYDTNGHYPGHHDEYEYRAQQAHHRGVPPGQPHTLHTGKHNTLFHAEYNREKRQRTNPYTLDSSRERQTPSTSLPIPDARGVRYLSPTPRDTFTNTNPSTSNGTNHRQFAATSPSSTNHIKSPSHPKAANPLPVQQTNGCANTGRSSTLLHTTNVPTYTYSDDGEDDDNEDEESENYRSAPFDATTGSQRKLKGTHSKKLSKENITFSKAFLLEPPCMRPALVDERAIRMRTHPMVKKIIEFNKKHEGLLEKLSLEETSPAKHEEILTVCVQEIKPTRDYHPVLGLILYCKYCNPALTTYRHKDWSRWVRLLCGNGKDKDQVFSADEAKSNMSETFDIKKKEEY